LPDSCSTGCPAKIILDDADRDALPGVVTAWVHWAGEQTGLKQAAVAQLLDVARDCGEDFREAYDQGEDASPIRQFLQGLDTHGDLADAQDALDRRMFATPYFGARIGEEDYPRLNPGDPDERRLLIEGEHPEYHAALADPAFDGEIDGVNPRRHIAIHEVVANQLWEDDPAGAWRAATEHKFDYVSTSVVSGITARRGGLAGGVLPHVSATVSGAEPFVSVPCGAGTDWGRHPGHRPSGRRLLLRLTSG
jgi:predicted XRE-type DNA-binding protein